ncbi:MAG: hypothetical protein AAF585_26490, partial [Verrucomicrobiota bacterium]
MTDEDLQLIDAWRHFRITEEQFERMQDRLREDAELRAEFRALADIESALGALAIQPLSIDVSTTSRAAQPAAAGPNPVRFWIPWVIAGFACVAAAVSWFPISLEVWPEQEYAAVDDDDFDVRLRYVAEVGSPSPSSADDSTFATFSDPDFDEIKKLNESLATGWRAVAPSTGSGDVNGVLAEPETSFEIATTNRSSAVRSSDAQLPGLADIPLLRDPVNEMEEADFELAEVVEPTTQRVAPAAQQLDLISPPQISGSALPEVSYSSIEPVTGLAEAQDAEFQTEFGVSVQNEVAELGQEPDASFFTGTIASGKEKESGPVQQEWQRAPGGELASNGSDGGAIAIDGGGVNAPLINKPVEGNAKGIAKSVDPDSYANIGNGGRGVGGVLQGNISVDGIGKSTDPDLYAAIGHGGRDATSTSRGNITLTDEIQKPRGEHWGHINEATDNSGELFFERGGNLKNWTQVGHGGYVDEAGEPELFYRNLMYLSDAYEQEGGESDSKSGSLNQSNRDDFRRTGVAIQDVAGQVKF